MKVLFLSSWYPTRINPFNGDFIERHALAVSGICNTAVLHVQSDSIRGPVFEIVERKHEMLEIIIYFKRCNSRIILFARLMNLIRYVRGYIIGFRILRKKFGKADIIHANIIYPAAIVAWLYSKFSGLPYIISEHWTLYLSEGNRNIPALWITRRAVRRAFAVTPVTFDLELALRKHGYRSNYFIVPNVVDTGIFKPGQAPVPSERIKLLHVSSMKEEQKNIMGILRTIKRLSEIRGDFMITFIGSAQEHQKALARKLEIPERMIVFIEEMTHAEVAANMQQSHVLVMFSRTENLPCVILEALSCGLPVISSDVGGIRDWIGGNTGILVESENEDRLLLGLIFMLNNYSKYDRDYLHQYAIQNFSMEIIAGRFYRIYEKALKPAGDV
jgi:glycosyltransferase involved in cell wall biosynthesis